MCVPVLFTLEQLPVGGDLELEPQLGVHQVLQLLEDRLHLRAKLGHLVLEVVVLRLPLALLLLVLAAEELQLLLELRVLWDARCERGVRTSAFCGTRDVRGASERARSVGREM